MVGDGHRLYASLDVLWHLCERSAYRHYEPFPRNGGHGRSTPDGRVTAILAYSFRDVRRALTQHAGASIDQQRFIWMLGALLFGFLMTFWSISLFDQSGALFLPVPCHYTVNRSAAGPDANTVAEGPFRSPTTAWRSGIIAMIPGAFKVFGERPQKGVSVLIVSWNTRELLASCLTSIRESNPTCVVEVIVVDNASEDGSQEMVETRFPDVRLIRAGSNLGFAKGNNLAMQYAVGSMFALVNSDALVHSGCIETLADYLDQHREVGLVGPRVTGADGLLQRTCRHLPGLWNTFCRALVLDRVFGGRGIFSGYEVSPAQHELLHEAEVLSGCFCLARRSAVESVGGLDEQFFFYGEDIDWCRRFKDAGWKLVFIPQATATHFGGGSTSKAPLRYSIEILRASLKYWRKHHGVAGQAGCYGLLILHHGLRLLARSGKRALGLGRSPDSRYKLNEDIACLRWLLFGTEPNDTRLPAAYPSHPEVP